MYRSCHQQESKQINDQSHNILQNPKTNEPAGSDIRKFGSYTYFLFTALNETNQVVDP